MRLFIGLPIAARTTDELAGITERLRDLRPSGGEGEVRWSARAGWHITLQFLGSSTQRQYDCLVQALRNLHHAPVLIGLEGIATFGRPGVLMAMVRLTPALAALQQDVVLATAPCGYVPEDRPYRPHITLARMRGRQEIAPQRLHEDALPMPGFVATEVLLYESRPQPGGSRYEVRERFALNGTPA